MQFNGRKQKLKALLSGVLLICSGFGYTSAYGFPTTFGTQNDALLDEVSGLAASNNQPGYFWAINDSGNDPALILLDEDGQRQDDIVLDTLGNHDWEDLETFTSKGKNYIAIADIGDNYARRKVYYIHLIPEPLVSQGTIAPIDPDQIQTLAFQYEDGPRDAEALGVDIQNDRILLLTKRDSPPRMYSLPLVFSPKRYVYRAEHLTDIPSLGGMSLSGSYLSQTLYAGLPTAMAVVPGSLAARTQLAVLSYGTVWLVDVINSRPVATKEILSVNLPPMPQAEAMAVDKRGNLTIMSENLGSALVRINKQ